MPGIRSSLSIMAVALAACGGSSEPAAPANTGGTTGGTGAPTATNQVSIGSASFDPSSILVAPGTTVTWTFATAATHNVTFNTAGLGGSGDRSSGTYTKDFATAGTFSYHCTIHSSMTGTVTVQ